MRQLFEICKKAANTPCSPVFMKTAGSSSAFQKVKTLNNSVAEKGDRANGAQEALYDAALVFTFLLSSGADVLHSRLRASSIAR